MADTVRLRSSVPTFSVADVATTARWYVTHLGFALTGHVPKDEPYAFASLQRDDAEIMLLRDDAAAGADAAPRSGWHAYFRTQGTGRLYASVATQSFVTMPLTHQPYGDWEFEVRDPNGYVLVFGGER